MAASIIWARRKTAPVALLYTQRRVAPLPQDFAVSTADTRHVAPSARPESSMCRAERNATIAENARHPCHMCRSRVPSVIMRISGRTSLVEELASRTTVMAATIIMVKTTFTSSMFRNAAIRASTTAMIRVHFTGKDLFIDLISTINRHVI